MSVRQIIREAWKTRLNAIGHPVAMGELSELGPDDPPKAIALFFVDIVKRVGKKKFHRTTVTIRALASEVNLEEPWVAIDEIVAAIKTAIETADATVAGVPIEPVAERDLEREPGSETVGAELTYEFAWAETWGAP